MKLKVFAILAAAASLTACAKYDDSLNASGLGGPRNAALHVVLGQDDVREVVGGLEGLRREEQMVMSSSSPLNPFKKSRKLREEVYFIDGSTSDGILTIELEQVGGKPWQIVAYTIDPVSP